MTLSSLSTPRRLRWRWAWLCLVVMLSTSCEHRRLPAPGDEARFLPFERDLPKPTPIEPAATSAKKQPESKLITDTLRAFEERHEQILQRDDLDRQLGTIERAFAGQDRSLDLYRIYRKDFDKRGYDSPVAARLAWAYLRMGQEGKASEMIGTLLERDPRAALHWFLLGASKLQGKDTTREQGADTVVAWQRAFSLDPTFRGPEGISGLALRQEANKIVERQQLTRADLDAATARLPAMSPADDQGLRRARKGLDRSLLAARASTSDDANKAPDGAGSKEGAGAEGSGDKEGAARANTVARTNPVTRSTRDAAIALAEAEIALSQGSREKAFARYIEAEKLGLKGSRQEFAHLRLGWQVDKDRASIRRRFAKLAAREDLAPRLAYDMAFFAMGDFENPGQAKRLLLGVKERDPKLAKRLDVDGLLKKLE